MKDRNDSWEFRFILFLSGYPCAPCRNLLPLQILSSLPLCTATKDLVKEKKKIRIKIRRPRTMLPPHAFGAPNVEEIEAPSIGRAFNAGKRTISARKKRGKNERKNIKNQEGKGAGNLFRRKWITKEFPVSVTMPPHKWKIGTHPSSAPLLQLSWARGQQNQEEKKLGTSKQHKSNSELPFHKHETHFRPPEKKHVHFRCAR